MKILIGNKKETSTSSGITKKRANGPLTMQLMAMLDRNKVYTRQEFSELALTDGYTPSEIASTEFQLFLDRHCKPDPVIKKDNIYS